MTLCILLGIAGTCVYAASIPEEDTVHTEETAQELMPMMARGCSNYDYDGYTMNQLKVEKRMDIADGQDPHFHLNAYPGVHYILGGI